MTRRPLMLLCASLFLSGGALAQVELRYAPEEGVVLRRNFEVKHFLALKRSVTRLGGLEELAQRTYEMRNVETLQTSDRILASSGGRATRMRRYFDRGALEGFAELSEVGRAFNMRALGLSRLKGKSVMFTWVPEDQVYGRYFDSAEGVEEDLIFMREDLDLRGFLPADAVQVGDSWAVEAVALGDALSPGGMLSFDFSKSKSMGLARTLRLGTGSHLFELFTQEVKGEVTATLTAIEESDEGRFAVVSVAWEVQTQTDLATLARRNKTGVDVELDRALKGMDVGLELKGEGSFKWDLNGGHLRSYEFRSSEDVSSSVKIVVGEDEGVREEILDMGGQVFVTGEVERR